MDIFNMRESTCSGICRCLFAAAAVALCAVMRPPAHSADGTVLKFAVIVPERSIWGEHLKSLAKEIKEETNGGVSLKVYYGGVQGDELNVLQKMRIGQLHGAGFMAYGLSKVCPDSLVLSIPTLFRDPEEAAWVRGKMEGYFQKQSRERGFEIIGWTNQGFTYCFSRDRVGDFATLRNAKPWALEKDELSNAFFRSASISSIPLGVGDVNTALQSGLVRTVFAPPTGMLVMQWHARVNFRLDIGIFYSFGAIVVANDQWNKISEEHRKIVREVFQKHIADLNVAIDRQNNDALKVLDSKLEVIKPAEKAVEEFREVTAKVEAEMTGTNFSDEAMNLLKSHLEDYRKAKSKSGTGKSVGM